MQQTNDAHYRVARDSSPRSQDAYYDPSTVVLCLVALCLALLAPTLLILWRGRPNRREGKLLPPPPFLLLSHRHIFFLYNSATTIAVEQRYHRRSRASSLPTAWGQPHSPWPLPRHRSPCRGYTVGADFETTADVAAAGTHQEERTRRGDERLRQLALTSGRAITAGARAAWKNASLSLAGMKPRGRRRHRGNTGVSIDLPIMSRPAWQKLASGSVAPSRTLDDLADAVVSGEAERMQRAERAAAQLKEGEARTEEGAGPMPPQPALTVGLAIG